MDKNYDVIIIGAGPSGIFCAYELKRQNPRLKVLMIEKGRCIEKRRCPKRTTNVCAGCKPCSITTGFAGAGAFSDGKLSLSPDVGGTLPEILGYEKAEKLIHEADEIYLKFGADRKVYGIDDQAAIWDIRTKAIRANLKLIECPIRHLGTEEGYKIYTRLQEHLLAEGVEILFMTMVKDILIEDGKVKGVVTDKQETFYAPQIAAGVGREGSEWFAGVCSGHHIETRNGTVDVGVRVEVRDEIMKELNEKLYEAKLVYYTPTFDLLVSKNFTEPFRSPVEYGKHIAQLGNMLSDGKILLQRYGDFKRGRRTTAERLTRNNIIPTLKDAVPGDLSLVLPHRIMVAVVEMIEALDKVTPGIASDETLLYGVEVKFYSNKVLVNTEFETNIKGLRSMGDGASITRGLMQASANGLSTARAILKTFGEQQEGDRANDETSDRGR